MFWLFFSLEFHGTLSFVPPPLIGVAMRAYVFIRPVVLSEWWLFHNFGNLFHLSVYRYSIRIVEKIIHSFFYDNRRAACSCSLLFIYFIIQFIDLNVFRFWCGFICFRPCCQHTFPWSIRCPKIRICAHRWQRAKVNCTELKRPTYQTAHSSTP